MTTIRRSLDVIGHGANVAGSTAPLDFTPISPECRFRVLFVYPNLIGLSAKNENKILAPHLGLQVLSACVRRIGAGSTLCDLTTVPSELNDEVLRTCLEQDRPDLVAVTAVSNQWPAAARVVDTCRRMGVPHIVGGPHATFCPEEVIAAADSLVVGEGEGALMDVVRAMAERRPVAGIPNTWVRTPEGRVIRTARRTLIQDLDELPFPDWNLFQPANFRIAASARSNIRPRKNQPSLIRTTIEGSRGCPFTCAYCANSFYLESYKGKGRWRREKSPQRIIAELQACRTVLGGLDYVEWVDEIFMTNAHRLAELADAYRREIAVPFDIMDRPELVTAPKVKMLADAGLVWISMGLESGDEALREKVLNRKISQDVLRRAFTLPGKYGVKVYAFAIVGLPGQDEVSMLKTWHLIRETRPDGAQFSLFHPKRGTALYDECVKRGLYDPRKDTEPYRYQPVIKHDLLDDATIMRYQQLLTHYAATAGLWALLAFHLGRRSPRICRLLLWGRRRRRRTGRRLGTLHRALAQTLVGDLRNPVSRRRPAQVGTRK